LVPPGRKSYVWRGVRRAVLLSTLLLTVVVATGFAAVRLSPLAVSAARPIVAALWTAPQKLMAGHVFGQPASPAKGTPVTAATAVHVASPQPPSRGTATPPPRQTSILLAAGMASTTNDHRPPPRAAAPVVLYSAPVDQSAKLSQGDTAPQALPKAAQALAHQPTPRPAQTAPVVTMLSEATLVVPPSAEAPVVLPVTFGRPTAPENDAEPVRLHWRYHGLVAAAAPRRSVFRTEPSDSIEAMCRTLEPLQ
jgi:hypothetical protein